MQRSAPASIKIARVAVFVLLTATALLSGCGSRTNPSTQPQTAEQRNAAIVAIAQQFGATEDLEAAQVALAPLNLPNPGQSVLGPGRVLHRREPGRPHHGRAGRAGQGAGAGQPHGRGLPGARGRQLRRAGRRGHGADGDTPANAHRHPCAAHRDSDAGADGHARPTTPEPTATPTATPVAQPQASTTSAINVRSGPGTVYPVVAQLQPGQPVDILGAQRRPHLVAGAAGQRRRGLGGRIGGGRDRPGGWRRGGGQHPGRADAAPHRAAAADSRAGRSANPTACTQAQRRLCSGGLSPASCGH